VAELTPLTHAELEALAALDKRATHGPWTTGVQRIDSGTVMDRNHRQVALACGEAASHDKRPMETDAIQRANASLIAAARNALPRLLSQLSAQAKRIEELEGALGKAYGLLNQDGHACRWPVLLQIVEDALLRSATAPAAERKLARG
jgi:hypothetical protein